MALKTELPYIEQNRRNKVMFKEVTKTNQDEQRSGGHLVHHITDIITGILILMLFIRFTLHIFGSITSYGVGKFVVTFTEPLVRPFEGVFPARTTGAMSDGLFEVSAILSMIAIAFMGYAVRQLLNALEKEPNKVYESKIQS